MIIEKGNQEKAKETDANTETVRCFIQGFSDFYFLVPMERRQCVFKRQVKVNQVGPLKAGVVCL